jgi:hypothetical protein
VPAKPAIAPPAPPAAPKAKGLIRHRFAKDDLAKMPDAPVGNVGKPRGLQRHTFAAEDLKKMGDDRGFAPPAPKRLEKSAFALEDQKKMREAEPVPEGPLKTKGVVRHKFDTADLAKMGDDRGFEPERPAGFESHRLADGAKPAAPGPVVRPKGFQGAGFGLGQKPAPPKPPPPKPGPGKP